MDESQDYQLNTQRIRIKLDKNNYSPPKHVVEKSSQGNSTDNLGERTLKEHATAQENRPEDLNSGEGELKRPLGKSKSQVGGNMVNSNNFKMQRTRCQSAHPTR